MQSQHLLASLRQGTLPADADTADVSSSVSLKEVRNNWLPRSRLSFAAGVAVCFAVFGGAIALKLTLHSSFSSSRAAAANAELLDQRLQRAATQALGDRRGTIIVMDPQTGRIRAMVNPEIAFRENFPVGSAIKPFTALAALRSWQAAISPMPRSMRSTSPRMRSRSPRATSATTVLRTVSRCIGAICSSRSAMADTT